MRREIFAAVSAALHAVVGSDETPIVRHVALWNRNVEFIEEEEPWDRPAVFVEFGEIDWIHSRPSPGHRVSMHCTSELLLHVVTDGHSCMMDECFAAGESLFGKIKRALTGLCGTHFVDMYPVKELSNHDHGELVEEILVFSYRGHEEY